MQVYAGNFLSSVPQLQHMQACAHGCIVNMHACCIVKHVTRLLDLKRTSIIRSIYTYSQRQFALLTFVDDKQ